MGLTMPIFTIFYGLALEYFIVSFFVKVPPFRQRRDAALVGIPALAVGAFILYPFVLDNYDRRAQRLELQSVQAEIRARVLEETGTREMAAIRARAAEQVAARERAVEERAERARAAIRARAAARVNAVEEAATEETATRTRPVTYNPRSVSAATGQTIRQLDEQQRVIVTIAAKFMTIMNYCNYSFRPGENPIVDFVGGYGVHVYDFKRLTRRLTDPTLTELRNGGDWQYFCGTEIYDVFGPNGELFGSGGTYPNIDPWIRRTEVGPGMTRAKLEEEIRMTAAYFGSTRCNVQYDERKDAARRRALGMDIEWTIAADSQTAPIVNEAMFRLGPESLMNCSLFEREYGEYLLR